MDDEINAQRTRIYESFVRLRKDTDACFGKSVQSDDPKEDAILALCAITASQQRLIGMLIRRIEAPRGNR